MCSSDLFKDLEERLKDLTKEAQERHVLATPPDYDERLEEVAPAS